MKTREVVKMLKQDGWYEMPGKPTAHKQFKHPTKPGKVTVSSHGAQDLSPMVLRSIERQSGLRLRPG